MPSGMVGSYDELYMSQLGTLAEKGDRSAQYALKHKDRIVFWLYPFGDRRILRGVGLIKDKEKSPDERYNIRWIEFHNNRN